MKDDLVAVDAPPAGRAGAIELAGERRSSRVESVRAIAALAVLVCHVYSQVNGFQFDTYAKRVVTGGGLFGVFIFFALSGYLLYLPFARAAVAGGPSIDLRGYARNRATRILPLYFAVVIGVAVIEGSSLRQLVRYMTFTQSFDSNLVARGLDGPMWSLVVELHFYVLLPFLALALGRLGRGRARPIVVALLALGFAGVVVSKSPLHDHDVWAYSLPSTFQYFVPGMVLAVLKARHDQLPASWADSRWGSPDVWLLASLPVWAIVFYDFEWAPLATVACFAIVAAAVFPNRSRRGWGDRLLEWRPVALVGACSYSLYLWHVPVLRWLPAPPDVGWRGFAEMLALSLPVCLAVAGISYALVERPSLRLRRPWIRRPGSDSAPRPLLPAAVRADRRLWGAILGVGAALRVGAVVLERHQLLGADSLDYDRLGRLLAAGDGFGQSLLAAGGGPTAFRPPLYPMLLGAVYRATGGSQSAGRLVGVALGVGVITLVGYLGTRLFSRRVGLVAAAITAVYPQAIVASAALMSEALFVPLELAALALVVAVRPRTRRAAVVGAGLLCGLAVLTRPSAGAAVLVGVCLLVWGVRPWLSWRAAAAPAIAVGAALLVVTPWLVRDAVRMGEFVPVSNLDAFNLAGVYNSVSAAAPAPTTAQFRPPIGVPEYTPLFSDPTLDETAVADRLRRGGMDYLRAHPFYVGKVVVWNTARIVDVVGRDTNRSVYAADWSIRTGPVPDAALAAWGVLAVLAVVALGREELRRVPFGLWVVPILLWLSTVVVLGHSRFRVPIEPFVTLLASVAIVRISAHLARSRAGSG